MQEKRKKERRITLRKATLTKSLLGNLLPSAPNKFEHRSYSAINHGKHNELGTEYSPAKNSDMMMSENYMVDTTI